MRGSWILFTLLLWPGAVSAQKAKRRCTGSVPDSVLTRSAPVYLDCDVDEPAKPPREEPTLQLNTANISTVRGGCMRVELEFVVDAQGVPESGTIKTHPGNHVELEAVVIPSVNQLRYRPAMLDGVPVRQVVIYHRAVAVVTRVVSSSGGPVVPARTTPPHC